MLDLKFIRENPEIVRNAIKLKNISLDLDLLLSLDRDVAVTKKQVQAMQEEKNSNAKKVPLVNQAERPLLIETGKRISKDLESLKPKLQELEDKLKSLMWLVPNIPASDAPIGSSADDNVEVKKSGQPKTFSHNIRNHIELLEMNDWADFERISKVSGSRSYSLKNEAVLLEFALIRFAMDKLYSKGFTLITVPSQVRESTLFGTGHFPTGRDQVYFIPEDNIYLSGTAEVPLNSLHSDEILNEKNLPLLYGGFSPCFRREAGSAGKDVRGLIRVHQFMKVEQFVICKNDPGESNRLHLSLLNTSEEIVQELELPYRVIECCTGDMGAGKVKMFDIESWMPSEQAYRETHSCSNLHDWQARRSNLRYRDSQGDLKYCHTLNNTAIATPRILANFIENHQQEDGTISIPKSLRPYLGGMSSLGRSRPL